MARYVHSINDDGSQKNSDGTIDLTATTSEFSSSSILRGYVAYRITNITVAQASTVRHAYLKVHISAVATASTANWLLSAHASDNSPALTTTVNDISSRTLTTANFYRKTHDLSDGYIYLDVTALAQEVVNRAGWTSGSAMTFIFTGPGASTVFTASMTESANVPEFGIIVADLVTSALGPSSTGTGTYTNPTNAYTSNNTYATTTNDQTASQIYGGFGIPDITGATVHGIKVTVEASVASTTSMSRYGIELSWDTGTTWTTLKSSLQVDTADSTYVYGGSDAWSHTFTPAELTDTNFKVRITNDFASSTNDASVDYISVEVMYSLTDVAKTAQYAVITTPADITKSAQYTVPNTPTAVTKTADYDVTITTDVTKSAQYAVIITTSVTKTAEYVAVTTVDITKTAQYAIIRTADVTKSAQYAVVRTVDVTKSAQYAVSSTPATVTKSAQYTVIRLTDVTKSAQYNVVAMVDITKLASYSILTPEELDSTNLKKLKIGKKYGPITSVILGRVPQNDNVVIASKVPEANVVSAVNTGTDLLTVTANAMVNGNLVRIESTGTLPAPLRADTNYYVFTNGDANTFALTNSYAEALTGAGIIDINSVGTGTITLSHLLTQEVQINNNQIVDDDRQTLLPPIYTRLVGLEWNEVKAETVGLGWHEVGDIVIFNQGSVSVYGFIDEVHLTLAGSIKETLVSSIPDVATINYQTAGGILKTLYNTEIKVDKQENDITSVVSQQSVFEDQTTTDFTELYQNIESILLTIQKSGGGNLLLNSVGFARDTTLDNAAVSYEKLSSWDYNASYQISTHGSVLSYASSESQNAGGVSGEVIEMSGASVSITQRVDVAAGTSLSFAMRVKNLIGQGDATITISNTVDTFTLTVDDAATTNWEEIKLEDFTTTLSWLDIKIQVTSATSFMFTDLRLLYGSTLQGWVQAPTEILTALVQFTKDGMRIFDNVHDTETRVSYNEFSTRRKADNVILFEADDTGVVTNDLAIKGSTSYVSAGTPVIKQLTIPVGSALAGIAFIKVV